MTAPTAPTEVVIERTPEDGRLLVRPPGLARRRPVLSFLGALVLVCLVLAVAGRSGVAAPRVRLLANGSLGDPASGCVGLYSVVNDGLRPAEVEGMAGGRIAGLLDADVGFDPRWSGPTLTLTPDDIPPFAPFTLASGTSRLVAVDLPCDADPITADVEVHVRSTDLGLRREIRPTY